VAKVPKGVIQLNKRLVSLEDRGPDGVELKFQDGDIFAADLVVGADGIRSASS
jgi:salicylate hydroxylase